MSFLPVEERLRRLLADALLSCRQQGLFDGELPEIKFDRPKRPEHGDFATNLALALARRAGRPPREIASRVVEAARAVGDVTGLLAGLEVAGPGFINLRLAPSAWHDVLRQILEQGSDFGRGEQRPDAPPVLIEFVSANPTGPLHVGHGRGAAVGDALARLLRFAGYRVGTEFYVNDAGNQVQMLALSTWVRYLEALRDSDPALPPAPPFPENGYHGDYVRDLGRALAVEVGDRLVGDFATPPADLTPIREFAVGRMLAELRRVLGKFGVFFDCWFSERGLHESGALAEELRQLEVAGQLYQHEGARWFRTTALSADEKDRVLVKRDGEVTYLASDIAYHRDKLGRGWGRLIDIWGADHHGHVERMRAAMRHLGRQPDDLEVILVQFVSLLRDGEKLAMGKRSGEFVTLEEVLDEVGTDAARYFFLMRRHDSHVDFDLELAKRQSLDNPVYYLQYAHARACSILRRASELGARRSVYSPALVARLTLPEEISLLRRMADFPKLVEEAAQAREPHRIIFFLGELAQEFQSYYTRLQKIHGDTVLPQRRQRVGDWQASWDWQKSEARLLWIDALRVVLGSGLGLLGISAPEQLTRVAALPEDTEGEELEETEEDGVGNVGGPGGETKGERERRPEREL